MQGIAARYALRQASGQTAKEYAALMPVYSDLAWEMIEKLQKAGGVKGLKAKL